jgi:hypothetical protein
VARLSNCLDGLLGQRYRPIGETQLGTGGKTHGYGNNPLDRVNGQRRPKGENPWLKFTD